MEIRLHRDCDSRWVADSAPEVFMESPTSILQKTSAVVYKARIWTFSSVGQSARLISGWSWVQVPEGPLSLENNEREIALNNEQR